MLDTTKPVQTRDGRKARIYATDGGGVYPVHGALQDAGWVWLPHVWTSAGRELPFGGLSNSDLVNTPVKHTREFYLIAWGKEGWRIQDTPFLRGLFRVNEPLICFNKKVTVEFTEGEGL